MKNQLIPKTIHLCWFSGDKYPNKINQCIKSWKRVLPDYTIKIWDFEMATATKIKFVEQALSVRKWAFAADVIRLYAIYTEGGIYMDSDIFLKERFDDFLNNETTFFMEYHSNSLKKMTPGSIDELGNRVGVDFIDGMQIQAALFASVKGSSFIKQLLDYYRDKDFILSDGTYFNQMLAPHIYALQAEKIGFKYIDELQSLDNGVVVYSSDYVASRRDCISTKAFAAHLCAHSWYDRSLRQKVVYFYKYPYYKAKGLMKRVSILFIKIFYPNSPAFKSKRDFPI